MSILDIFAIIVLILLALFAVVFIAIIGWLPGSIARKRQHPHAQAVVVVPDGSA